MQQLRCLTAETQYWAAVDNRIQLLLGKLVSAQLRQVGWYTDWLVASSDVRLCLHYQLKSPGAAACAGKDTFPVRTTYHKPDKSWSLDVWSRCASEYDHAVSLRRWSTCSRSSSEMDDQSCGCACGSGDWTAVRMLWSSLIAGTCK